MLQSPKAAHLGSLYVPWDKIIFEYTARSATESTTHILIISVILAEEAMANVFKYYPGLSYIDCLVCVFMFSYISADSSHFEQLLYSKDYSLY